MREHITFDAIECQNLQYVKTSHSWVCLARFDDLKHVDTCMRCKFAKKTRKEVKCVKRILNAKFAYNAHNKEVSLI